MAGYSKNPLWKKLGVKAGYHCALFQSPENYFELLEETPVNTVWDYSLEKTSYDFIHVFVVEKEVLKSNWDCWKAKLKKDGVFWISWPKGTSQIKTDLNGNEIRAFGLKGGLVDVKVCAVDDNWSGLKFMFRKNDR